jgi:hypothetical protein
MVRRFRIGMQPDIPLEPAAPAFPYAAALKAVAQPARLPPAQASRRAANAPPAVVNGDWHEF